MQAIDSVVLRVPDIDAAAAWYAALLQASVEHDNAGFAFVRAAGTVIGFHPADTGCPAGTTVHWAVPDLDRAIESLLSRGARLHRRPLETSGGARLAMLVDPFGCTIGLRAPHASLRAHPAASDPTIRALAPADAAAFQALRLRGLLECPSAFASSFDEESRTPLAEVEARLAPQPDAAIFGAFGDARLDAVVGLQRERMARLAHKAFVWGMYVAPQARRHGVGAALLRHALDHAATALGVRQVNLGVNAANAAALALYRGLGFVAYGFERDFLLVDGVPHDECLMVWRAPG